MGTASRPTRALGARPSDRSIVGPGCTASPSVGSESRCRPSTHPVRPLRDHPRPIPLQLGLAIAQQCAPIGRRHGLLHPPSPFRGPPRPRATARTLQTNEMALYRCPPSAFFFSPPQRGRGGSDWPDILGSPLPFTNHREGYTPSGVVQPMRKRARRPAVQFLPRLGSFAVLNS